MLSNLLIFRMAIANVCWTVALACVWQAGYVKTLFTTDSTNISYGIAALFVVGLISTFNRALKVSAAINEWKTIGFAQDDAIFEARAKAAKMDIKNAHIKAIASWLTGLGLLGTIIGFRIALDGSAMEDSAMVREGMYAAIGTTIVGLVLSLWTLGNLQMLDTATFSHQEDCK